MKSKYIFRYSLITPAWYKLFFIIPLFFSVESFVVFLSLPGQLAGSGYSLQDLLTILFFSLGILVFILNYLISYTVRAEETNEKSITLLRDRWDALRNDDDLVSIFSSSTELLSAEKQLKLRVFLISFLDAINLVIGSLRHGYLIGHERELAFQTESTIKTLFSYPCVIENWNSQDNYGNGCLRAEYNQTMVFIVDKIIEEILLDKKTISSKPRIVEG